MEFCNERLVISTLGAIIEDTANVEQLETLPTEKGDNSSNKTEKKGMLVQDLYTEYGNNNVI